MGAGLSACEMPPLMHPPVLLICVLIHYRVNEKKTIISEPKVDLDCQIICIITESHGIAVRANRAVGPSRVWLDINLLIT